MAKNYFAIERENKCCDHICLVDDNDNIVFQDLMGMSYEEMKSYADIDKFVVAAMDASNEAFDSCDEQTIITLVGEDGLFIWSVIIDADGDDFRYSFVDWKKDGRSYRYSQEG